MVSIRPATPEDEEFLWMILEPLVRGGEVFALPRDMTKQAALAFWGAKGSHVFVAESEGIVVGMSYIRANNMGGGSHVANAGYAIARGMEGQGVARALCAHSLEFARSRGFRGMQFNFVVSTNMRAVNLWKRFGFKVVGTLPMAFHHPVVGFVDAYVMFLDL